MHLSDEWQLRFPDEVAVDVVNLIRSTWDSLVFRKIRKFSPESNEPHLTQFLCAVLKTESLNAGLSGKFTAEESDPIANLETGVLENLHRSDIRYFSDRANLDLTFEFKKLSVKKTSYKAYSKNGMFRFVNGKYSRDQKLAFMVGIISDNSVECVEGLKLHIQDLEIVKFLEMQENEEKRYLHKPSHPQKTLSNFDTQHQRSALSNPSKIVLCHLFLTYGSAADNG
tara:strand:+ start:1514 stop:2191 length:678 start_codon:yes stop_codon:yes gene_type:complete